MADKVITVKEPGVENIQKLVVHYSNGVPSHVEVNVLVLGTELTPAYMRKTNTPWNELETELQDQLTAVKLDALERAKEDLGFKERRQVKNPPEPVEEEPKDLELGGEEVTRG